MLKKIKEKEHIWHAKENVFCMQGGNCISVYNDFEMQCIIGRQHCR